MSGRDIRYDAVGEGSRHKSSWVSGRSRTGERGRDRHHRDFKSGGDDRRRDKNYKYDREGIRDHDRTDRHRDYNRDKERRHRHRSRSHSSDRFRNRSKSLSPSRSPSKSKRRSGFDMAPPAAAMLPGAAVPGQLPGVPSAVPEMAQNMLPFGATQAIATFFSQVMTAIGGNSAGPGDAVVNVYINHEKKFAFVEMRTVEEASNAMALDGIIFEACKFLSIFIFILGVAVRVRRPTDYNPTLAAALGPGQPSPNLNLAAVGLASGAIGGAEGPDRVFVGGLPYYFTETQIKELLESFGTLHGFDLVKDRDTGNSKGYGFCVYQDPAVTDIACAALNGLKMGDKTLTVRRATASSGQSKTEQESILAQAQQHIAIQKMALQTSGMNTLGGGMSLFGETLAKVLCLTEAITADALADDEEYEEILEDMREECGKYGTLVNVVIPRPDQNGGETPGVGKVFLEYYDAVGCATAKNALSGRKFGGNTVNAFYYPEDKYFNKDYSA
ncbi:U2 snRNP auxiliary factor large subunit [Citrus sinensis]|uniref:U2 snRNP auxiliary factor large subunit n=1 Tax=Citrus sinensis TaxID=2711 RepID=A0ACB8NFH1_CITSI|nr:U2 snRNP auxiliary factor large subunit [Citrus sinensis]KAH9796922.1 U2 snRNP auxiliary factor large subunit [Citrus sinensis]